MSLKKFNIIKSNNNENNNDDFFFFYEISFAIKNINLIYKNVIMYLL